MSESPSENPSPAPALAQPWAIRLGFAVVVIFTLLVGLAFMDTSRRETLETVSETTAVGDTAYAHLPAPGAAPEPLAQLEGRPLMLARPEPVEVRDTHTERVGRDAERGLTIYRLSAAASAAEKGKAGDSQTLLLKLAPNKFAAVHPGAAP